MDLQQDSAPDTGSFDNKRQLTGAILQFGATIDPRALFPVLIAAAAELALSDPYAFALATCLDRGTKADIIWTIPLLHPAGPWPS